MLQVRKDCLVLYYSTEYSGNAGKIEAVKLLKPAYGGKVTKGVQKRVMSAVDVFLQSTDTRRIYNSVTQRMMNFQLGFVTTTISDICDWKADICYKQLLKPFLRVLKESHGVSRYVWKYELQKRGNVHYHVLIDQFVAYDRITQAWNRLQRRNRLTDAYAVKHGHFNPNSTDVHKIWKVDNVAAYIAKYMGKAGEDGRDMKGKIWDCSIDLKRKRYSAEWVWENDDMLKVAVGAGVEVLHLDNCSIVKCDPEEILTESQKIDYCLWKYQI